MAAAEKFVQCNGVRVLKMDERANARLVGVVPDQVLVRRHELIEAAGITATISIAATTATVAAVLNRRRVVGTSS
jgi:hypothetical protein